MVELRRACGGSHHGKVCAARGTAVIRFLLIPLLAAAIAAGGVVAAANRYQYYTARVIGKAGPEADLRRVDIWTGTREVRVCRDVDTAQIADVAPPPPPRPSGGDTPQTATDSAIDSLKASQYFIDLKKWRADHLHVNPRTLHVTKVTCAWEHAR
jgi:hypothetical protein